MKFCPACRSELMEKLIEGKGRLCCPDPVCGFVHWNNPIPVVAMIVETEVGVVLAHNKKWPAGMYSIITGFLEAGETPEECALRETGEELGLTASEASFVGVYSFPRMNQVIMAYHVAASGTIVLNDELDDYKLIPKSRLKSWDTATGWAVRDWLKRQI